MVYSKQAVILARGMSVGFDEAGNPVVILDDQTKKVQPQEVVDKILQARESLIGELSFLTTWLRAAEKQEGKSNLIVPNAPLIQLAR